MRSCSQVELLFGIVGFSGGWIIGIPGGKPLEQGENQTKSSTHTYTVHSLSIYARERKSQRSEREARRGGRWPRSPPPTQLSILSWAGIQFSRDSVRGFSHRVKIRENSEQSKHTHMGQDRCGNRVTLVEGKCCSHYTPSLTRYAGDIYLKPSFITSVRPFVHTNPSRKRNFLKTLFKPKKFWFRVDGKHFQL